MLRLENLVIAQDDWRMTADLAVAPDSVTAVIGPSGSGKSTLLAAVAGFLAPAAGRILWDGRDLTPLAPADRPVSLLFQEHNLFAHMTAAQNVGLGLRPDLRLDRAGWDRVAGALETVGLDGLRRPPPRQPLRRRAPARRPRPRPAARPPGAAARRTLRRTRPGPAPRDARPRRRAFAPRPAPRS